MTEKKSKVSLFLCRCGTNISDFVNLEDVASWASENGEIEFVETHDLLCSPAGKQFVEDKIKEQGADKVIVAACSPKIHEKTFQTAGEKAGLNMGQVSMANIREQCAWVTKDKDKATNKTKKLITAAIKRAAYHQDLEQNSMECNNDLVVIGGGIAGIEAALMAANAGRKVTIIEKDISLGGQIIKTEEVAPNMECAPCLLAPRLSAITENENITVISNAEVTDVLGFFGNFTVKAKKKARFVDDSCIGCEACFDVCPVSVKSAFHLGLGDRKAVYTAFPGSVPATAVIDNEHCKHFIDGSCDACVAACPFESINFEDKDVEIEIQSGALIIATGFEMADISHIERFGYNKIDNVYTMPEFERIAASNGPCNNGEILLKNGKAPESVAVIHCAGSLCEEGIPYCSGICCTMAAKVGDLVRKQVPHVKVTNIHDRLVYQGSEGQMFYEKQIADGTNYLKTDDLSSVKITQNGEKIDVSIKGSDTLTVDMVVLSTGLKPPKGTAEFAEMLNVDLDENGFYRPDHEILHSTGSTFEGVNVAGCCVTPCNAKDAVTMAQAAVGDALSKLIPGKKIELEILTSVINEEICAGCKLCISVCPYKAITYNEEKKVSEINEAICHGCGTCAATCPSGAATAKHFTDKQIYAEIGGVLNG